MTLWTNLFVVRLEAEHRSYRPFQDCDDVGDAYVRGIARELASAARAAMRRDDPRFVECRELVLEETQGDVLVLGDLARGDRPVAPTRRKLHEGPKAVLGAQRELEHGSPTGY